MATVMWSYALLLNAANLEAIVFHFSCAEVICGRLKTEAAPN